MLRAAGRTGGVPGLGAEQGGGVSGDRHPGAPLDDGSRPGLPAARFSGNVIPHNLQWHIDDLLDIRAALCPGVGLPGGPARPALLLPQQVLADPQRGRGGGGSLHDHLSTLPRPLPLARQRARPGHRDQGRLREVFRLNNTSQ